MATTSLQEQCEESISLLTSRQINFLALDFDLTVIDIHTGGAWQGTAEELATHVRPLFKHLIIAACEANMSVAIVTFSPQVPMIRAVLQLLVPTYSPQIPIRGADRTWVYEGSGSQEGKQAHMASAVEEILSMRETTITRRSTLLIDDDANNIKVALSEGVRAIWLNPRDEGRLLGNIKELLE
ncbi:hypothetical protein TrLO_g5470 [Triparma laevis f. longispina]|uniref:Uncharacterized protein n=1 Tax=Triparma laevis f. longispina TaxID=1714387 RepID=A0A9W6Z2B0_9STRA|nr:hypothetical protein TrLO_g5470 [Triparma laevis f. longispina]